MRVRSVMLLVFAALAAAFIALNWGELARPVALNFGVMQTQGPLGLVMLGLLLAACVVFAAYAVAAQATALLEMRQHNKEMKAQKDLADAVETSRFTELRGMIERIEADSQGRSLQTQQLLQQQLGQIKLDLSLAIEHSGNTLAAYMGELEDRLERGAGSGVSWQQLAHQFECAAGFGARFAICAVQRHFGKGKRGGALQAMRMRGKRALCGGKKLGVHLHRSGTHGGRLAAHGSSHSHIHQRHASPAVNHAKSIEVLGAWLVMHLRLPVLGLRNVEAHNV